MMTRLRTRFRRLRWKLTWSYTWVAALTFLIIETVLLFLLLFVIGFNPLQGDIAFYNEIVAPVLADDIRPITQAHIRNQPVDTAALQADLEQILGIEPLTTSRSPYEIEQFASVFVLDVQQNLLASTPQYTAVPPDGRFFDPTLLTGDDSLVPLVAAAYDGDTSIDQPYTQETPDGLYLVFAEPLADEAGRLLGVEIAIIRTPTPATVLLLALSVVIGGLTIFSLAAAMIGTLFGWRTARKFSGRLAHLSQTTNAWGQGNFVQQIEDDEADEIGELGQNLNRVAAELQALLADKQQIAVLEERDRMARELHDTLAQGVAGLVLQLEAVKHLLNEGEVTETQQIVTEATMQARDALHKARAAIDDLRAEAVFAPDFVTAVSQRVNNFSTTNNITCQLDAQLPDSLLLPPALHLHARRALKEILTNIAQHARATTASARLRLVDNCLLIEVADDGVGFDVATAVRPGHYGLIGLKERAQLTGGHFAVESSTEEGTTIRLHLPLENNHV
ncbi:histidine kinase [Candidatus Leptofilum sp.]|uniref:sensor histidine kinase n=1 Tax=Candidatus Leptofilum sp. TaxID=3241576 RepID=UPI003B5CB0E1